jgi:hypothetical protein
LPQVQPELSKLLELKAKLSEITDADSAGGRFVLKCPKVHVTHTHTHTPTPERRGEREREGEE